MNPKLANFSSEQLRQELLAREQAPAKLNEYLVALFRKHRDVLLNYVPHTRCREQKQPFPEKCVRCALESLPEENGFTVKGFTADFILTKKEE